MRYINGLAARQLENKTIYAKDIQSGNFISGEEVDCVQVDLGVVVVYYKSGNYSLFNRLEKVQVLRGQND